MKTITASQLRKSVTKYTNLAQEQPLRVTSDRKGDDAYLISVKVLESSNIPKLLSLSAQLADQEEKAHQLITEKHLLHIANAKLRHSVDKYHGLMWLFVLISVALSVVLWVA